MANLPTPQAILDWIATQPSGVGKREIGKAFGLHGADKIALKALLREMQDEGLLDLGPGRTLHRGGGLPKVTVLRIVEAGENGVIAEPDRWEGAGAAPRVRMVEKKRGPALGLGERVLARIDEDDGGYRGFAMKVLAKSAEFVLGVVRADGDGHVLVPVDKRARFDLPLSGIGDAQVGDLVLAEPSGRGPAQRGRVVEVLGDPFQPRAFSLIAIHAKGIPHVFDAQTLAEADASAGRGLGPEGLREDLRGLPFLTIDPADARDHDDAVWAGPDPEKQGHFRAIVAIADVSWYVRPGGGLDREARARGNSVYFPDQVVPMLPERLSTDVCSLVAGEDRAVLACHLLVAPDGKVVKSHFNRAVINCRVNIAYEEAQATIDAGAGAHFETLRPLWDCWEALHAARVKREPLAIDLPERRVLLDAAGRIAKIELRKTIPANQLIEDYMIAANVAAAQALEAKKAACMYRDHEPPTREKLVTLKDWLESFDMNFALGQVIRPAVFNRILAKVKGEDHETQVMEQVLRTQTQAYYAPENKGHFGLSLGSYAHFTSPIRRYADLIVHRSLVSAYGLGEGGIDEAGQAAMGRTAEHVSMTERRAMEAERDTLDRYVAAYLSESVGEIVRARITGVLKFGFFAQVDGLGGDGLVPVSALGDERFAYDEDRRVLEGLETGTRYFPGQRLDLRLVEANPITGSLRFALPDAEADDTRARSHDRPRGDRMRGGRKGGGPRGSIPRGIRRGRR
ncbi:MAG: ribonuclease R family protein [Polymorphobacter sp.]|uniref:ribonuclease R family protein n=1 Tax=Polymorphobacter sp. TaxID=1909290 RepID=UPI003A8397BB